MATPAGNFAPDDGHLAHVAFGHLLKMPYEHKGLRVFQAVAFKTPKHLHQIMTVQCSKVVQIRADLAGQSPTRLSTSIGEFSQGLRRVQPDVIRSLGYEADAQVGSAGFRIDLGIRHPDKPGQYIAAIECDGATYHSALWARERDRLRQDILENLGWRFHRIWSTDWFHRRDSEIRRLAAALEAARQAAGQGIKVRGANIGREVVGGTVEEPESASIVIDDIRLRVPAYERADIRLQSAVEPHEAPIHQLAGLVSRIVEIEGPIHSDEVARRVSAAFGKARTGSRITDATLAALKHAQRQAPDGIRPVGDFWLTGPQAENPPVRDRSAESGTLLKATALPPMEIAAAARLIATESGEMPPEDMVRAIARLMGFLRVGTDLQAVILSAIVR